MLTKQEQKRISALLSYQILDTPQEESFNTLVNLIAEICNVPMALISFMDAKREWHKASVGFQPTEVPKEDTICQYTINAKGFFEITDTKKDERLIDNPFVVKDPYVRYYAGTTLQSPEGYSIGTVCVLDKEVRELNSTQIQAIHHVAKQVMLILNLKKQNKLMREELDELLLTSSTVTKRQLQNKEDEINYLLKAIKKTAGVLELSPDGTILKANSKFLKLFKYQKEEIYGLNYEVLKFKDQNLSDFGASWKQISQGFAQSGRVVRKAKDNSEVHLHTMYAPIRDLTGKVVKVFKIAQDASIAHQAELKLHTAKEMAEKIAKSKDNFIANMSHEIRTPMNAIIGFTNLLENTGLSTDQVEYVSSVKLASINLLSIINDILDISKIESGMFSVVETEFVLEDIIQNIKNILNLKASEKQLCTRVMLDSELPYKLKGDGNRLQQILINLIGNAVKFTEKGEVGLILKVIEKSETDIKINFLVQDSGIGIPKDKLSLIFERFTQADEDTSRFYGGTGLGLNISKLLIERMKGSIQVNSTVKVGSEFSVTLPFGIVEETPSVHDVSEYSLINVTSLPAGLNILVCEDNVLNQKLVTNLLHDQDAKVTVASNGIDGLYEFSKDSFDLILMDIQMPNLDGYDTTSIIRNDLNHSIPIIALTAHSMVGEKEKCLNIGMNDYVSKPILKKDLFTSILLATQKSKPDANQERNLDLSYLSEFTGGNKEFEHEMISQFISETPKILAELIAENQLEVISKLAHKLKSSFQIFGIPTYTLQLLEQSENKLISTEKLNCLKSIVKKMLDDYLQLIEEQVQS